MGPPPARPAMLPSGFGSDLERSLLKEKPAAPPMLTCYGRLVVDDFGPAAPMLLGVQKLDGNPQTEWRLATSRRACRTPRLQADLRWLA